MNSSATVNYDHDYLKQYMVSYNLMDYGYIVRWQSELVNTNKSIIPVCDEPYQTTKGILQQ